MKLVKLELKNFLSYDELVYDFEDRPLLVQGLNLTDENQKSNGTGKSAMQTAIEFAITAQNSRGVRDKELVRYGHDEATVKLVIQCAVRKETLTIEWLIKVRGSNALALSINNEEVSFSNVNDGKKAILDWIRIDKDDLFNYFLINKTRFKSFFASSNREKVDLINRFSDASLVDGIENIDTDDLEDEIQKNEAKVQQLIGKIEVKKEDVENEKTRDIEEELDRLKDNISWDIREAEEAIEDYQEEIKIEQANSLKFLQEKEDLEKGIFAVQKLITNGKKEIEEQKSKLQGLNDNQLRQAVEAVEQFDTNSLERFGERREELNDTINDEESKLRFIKERKEASRDRGRQIDGAIEKFQLALKGAVTCPECSHEFLPNRDDQPAEELHEKVAKLHDLATRNEEKELKIDEELYAVEEAIENYELALKGLDGEEREELQKLQKLKEAVNAVKQRINEEVTKLNQLERTYDTVVGDVKKKELDILAAKRSSDNCLETVKQYEANIKLEEKKIKQLKKDMKSLQVSVDQEKILVLEKEIESLNKDKQRLLVINNSKGDQLYEANQWKANFKLFRLFVANQSLEAIGYHCNRFLQDMGSDMRVEFRGYKELANGTVKEEISAHVIRNGERTFSSFSGGEQGRLLFASILANRHMINSTHPFGGLDFLSIDEVFEGIDGLGLKHLVNSVKPLGITVMVITHVTDEEATEDTLTITKENGISRISSAA